MVPPAHDDRRVGRRLGAAMQVRLTPEQSAAIESRAERQGISASEALRQLLELGRTLDHGDLHGYAISDAVQRMVARREPLIFALAPDPDDPDAGPVWLVTPEEVAAHEDRA